MKKFFLLSSWSLSFWRGRAPIESAAIGSFLTALCLGFALTACDDSSSASSDETGVSSSSVESPDSSVTLSGASAESNGSSNETKDKSSSSENKSSSSTKETKVSSDSKSSSSVKSDDSSSSKKDTSSSSENSSSSKNQSSSSVKSSSSSVKQSSSSVASSSSFVKIDYTDPSHTYGELEDPRDHRKYKYLTVTGSDTNNKTATIDVMAENLNVGIMVQGKDDQADDLRIEKYCYNNDSLNCIQYGGLYQWAEAMQLPSECNTKSCADQIKPNHQGICPDDWRLLTHDDFYIVVHADENVYPLVEGVRAQAFGGHNYSGYALIGAGYNWNYEFRNIKESAYWHYPEEGHSNDVNIASFVGLQTKSSTSNSTQDTYKTHGFSVRCVKQTDLNNK